MQRVPVLAEAIQKITAEFSPPGLAGAAAELSGTYRGARKGKPRLDAIHRAAYLLTRMPATYAVVARILRECQLRIPDLRVQSLLDLGTGPGTALWATASQFPELERIIAVEDDPQWIALARQLAASSSQEGIRNADWRQGSVASVLPSGKFDLITASYVLNELPCGEISGVVRSAWKRTGKVLFAVEPGTPAGFDRIREVRRELIASGAFVVAPCPHASECPMRDGNWCHFAERLPRTSEHRQLKTGNLGYEDEKYSYVVVAREPVTLPAGRVLRYPLKHSGHVELELCTSQGLRKETISRRHGEKYKRARKAEWGDELG